MIKIRKKYYDLPCNIQQRSRHAKANRRSLLSVQHTLYVLLTCSRAKLPVNDNGYIVANNLWQVFRTKIEVRPLDLSFQTEPGREYFRHRTHLLGDECGVKHHWLGDIPDGQRAINLASVLCLGRYTGALEHHRRIVVHFKEVCSLEVVVTCIYSGLYAIVLSCGHNLGYRAFLAPASVDVEVCKTTLKRDSRMWRSQIRMREWAASFTSFSSLCWIPMLTITSSG